MPAGAGRAVGPEPIPPPEPAQVRAVPPVGRQDLSGPSGRKALSVREREAEARRRRLSARTNARTTPADFRASRLRQDRWNWRRKIRRDPRKLAFYRAVVGVLGTMFICLGLITGPLPGPGGIPLVLLGLAIWASEFHWAHKVLLGFRARLKQYSAWSLRQQVYFWLIFAGCCGVLVYSYLLVLGLPGWMPGFVQRAAELLPGV